MMKTKTKTNAELMTSGTVRPVGPHRSLETHTMQNEIIEINGKRYEFRTVGCLYGLYEAEKGPFEDGQKVPGVDRAPRQFSL